MNNEVHRWEFFIAMSTCSATSVCRRLFSVYLRNWRVTKNNANMPASTGDHPCAASCITLAGASLNGMYHIASELQSFRLELLQCGPSIVSFRLDTGSELFFHSTQTIFRHCRQGGRTWPGPALPIFNNTHCRILRDFRTEAVRCFRPEFYERHHILVNLRSHRPC